MHTTIKTLYEKGYNKSQIARILKVDRKTVRKVLKALDENGYVEHKTKPSILDPYKEYINIQVSKGLSAKRIYQDMHWQLGYEGSYDTVKRYVAKIKKNPPKAYMVLHSLPGEEAQVDFGYIGTLKLNGKRKKAWVFVMQLSYSRYMYAQIVFDQSVATFLMCHKNAFRYFGGVPQTVKIDNLKAAVFEANFYEPEMQRNYAAFASHYGFLADPCRVRTPTDKGKIESMIKYVKNNCFKARDFKNVDEARAFLKQWLNEIANKRVHGTTKKVHAEVFESIDHWAKQFISSAQAHGIISGYDERNFGPDDLITREQMAVMVVRAAKLDTATGSMKFVDSREISSWAVLAVGAAAEREVITGYPDNTFRPKQYASRAEAVTVIINALKNR